MFRSEHRVLDNLGQWVWIRARGRAVSRDAAGNVVRLAGTALNITNDRHVERERRIASAVLRNMNEAVAVHDHDFGFVSVNPAFTRMTRSEEHTSELQSLMRISYAVFCLKKNTTTRLHTAAGVKATNHQ